jgi:hypothetical protein
MFLEGDFIDTVIGIPDARTEMPMLRPPDDGIPARGGLVRPGPTQPGCRRTP